MMLLEGVDQGQRRRTKVVIGITGPIAAGKSTVAAMLEVEGAEVIDADHVYHELIEPHSPLWRDIVDHFGELILGPTMEIDRSALARMVFANPEQLAELERLTHGPIVAEIQRRLTRSHASIVVVEALKLVQSGLSDVVDAVWFVTADEQTRVERVQERGSIAPAEAMERIAASANVLPNGFHPDATIDTSGSLEATRRAVMNALRATVASAA